MHCVLCDEYPSDCYTKDMKGNGEICPIAAHVGEDNCRETPYELVRYLMRQKEHGSNIPVPQPAAQKEIDFLSEVRNDLINQRDEQTNEKF